MLILRLYAGTSLIRWPLKNTSPDVGVKKPPIIRSVVVFPQPLGPSNVRNSLSLMYRLMLSRMVSPSSKVIVRFDKRMSSLDIYHPPFHKCSMRKTTSLHIELNINKMSLFVNAFCNYFLQNTSQKGTVISRRTPARNPRSVPETIFHPDRTKFRRQT